MPLPSGLSLFIHLGIIFVAWILGVFGITRLRKKEIQPEGPLTSKEFARTVSVQVVSMLILFIMGSLMVTFFLVALQTGFREGASEPHRVYLKKTAETVGHALSGIPGSYTYESTREGNISVAESLLLIEE